MTVLSPSEVALGLELPDELAPWLDSLQRVGPPAGGLRLPRGDQALELLRRLGVVEPDLTVIAEALPTPEAQPELWWLLERSYQQLRRAIGRPDAAGWLPSLPSHLSAQGPCLWGFIFLSAAGETRPRQWER